MVFSSQLFFLSSKIAFFHPRSPNKETRFFCLVVRGAIDCGERGNNTFSKGGQSSPPAVIFYRVSRARFSLVAVFDTSLCCSEGGAVRGRGRASQSTAKASGGPRRCRVKGREVKKEEAASSHHFPLLFFLISKLRFELRGGSSAPSSVCRYVNCISESTQSDLKRDSKRK